MLRSILIVIVVLFLAYLIGSFVAASFYISKWGIMLRSVTACISIFISFIMCVISTDDTNDTDDTP